ncbi:hypothetical protein BaRGS_00010045 [Batillaria attramentaria]|uniref:Uncharacterized protein n=1 Tax=Batillaria attramentaria TaxID=370345 RepID=A0ABD0LGY9_9CAEN
MATLVDTVGQTTDFNMGLGKFETALGDEVVTEGFAKELEHYYDKAESPSDQNKCMQLLSSLRFGGDTRKNDVALLRPKTAMAALAVTLQVNGAPLRVKSRGPAIFLGATGDRVFLIYDTSQDRTKQRTRESMYRFQTQTLELSVIEHKSRFTAHYLCFRPMTSQGFAEPDTIPQAQRNTTYDEEFHKKHQRPASPYRSGTASGNRNNKPHPPKSFMVWKFPSKTHPFQHPTPWSEELTNEKLNQVTKRQYRSTYQNDYLGIPQGFQVKSAFNLPPDWKERVPYTLHSFQRSTYRTPQQQPELVVPTNRYGANRNKHLASSGVIPTANLRAVGIKTRTTYDRHYNDLAPAVAQQAYDVTRRLGADMIRAQHEKAFVEEPRAESGCRVPVDDYHYHQESGVPASPAPTPTPPAYTRPSVPTPTRARPMVPAATPITTFGTANHQHYPSSPPPSAISVPYSPPMFLA